MGTNVKFEDGTHIGKISIGTGPTALFTWAVHPSVIMRALLDDPRAKVVHIEDWGVETLGDFVELLSGRVDEQDYSLIGRQFS